MRKSVLSLFMAVVLCLIPMMTSFAQEETAYIVDQTGMLSEKAAGDLNEKAREVSQRYGVDVMYGFSESTDYTQLREFAHTANDIGSGSENGIFLVENEDYWYIYPYGSMEDLVTEEVQDALWEEYKKGDTLYDCVRNYISKAETLLDGYFHPDGSSGIPANSYLRLMDEADLLTDEEEETLLAKLDEISQRQKMDVVVVTVYSLDGQSPRDFADDYFDYNGYGQGNDRSGVLLLHSPEERDWWISTRGYGITVFTDAGIDYIGEQITPKLADGDNAGAYAIFAEECDRFITQAKTGDPFDVDNLPPEPLSLIWVPISLAVGFLFALSVVGGMKSKLKSVRFRPEANSYIREMNVTQSQDVFLYSHVDRRARPKSTGSGGGGSSSHSSSSGASHGGGGGKY